ncbi:MAG: metallophosphoesterase [Treponema sp.]|jgi:predicted MPP superfamily phosphohydrolase|nr:metallophosphoesterase [Treponema sp.]
MIYNLVKLLPVLLLAIFVYTIASCKTISTQEYTVETVSLSAGSVVRIVLVSDLHSTIHGKAQSTLINKIKQQNPDIIVLSGDIFDDVVPMDGTQLLLAGISGIAPIYYVTGNHEYWSHRVQEFRDELESYGVKILSDEYVRIELYDNEIIMAGIEDPDKKWYETPDYNQNRIMEDRFRELDEETAYKILVAHRPEKIEYYQKFSFDLILSGHTHGGQVRIPLIINGLYAPNQGLFPKYGGGIYRHDNSVHIISRGLSINPRLPRIFNPPELVVIVVQTTTSP